MVIQLCSVLENLSHWCESCPCHFDLLENEQGFHAGNRKRKRGNRDLSMPTIPELYKSKSFACPMRGKRLPELVGDGLTMVATNTASKGIMNLFVAHRSKLTENEWSLLLADFEKGKEVLELEMRLKLDFCKRLPWVLALLAHEDTAFARRELRPILSEYDQQPAALRNHHHPVTKKALEHGSPLRAEIDCFLSGTNIHKLPQLQFFAGCFRFVQITERYLEASHSIVKRKVPPNSAGPMVSLSRRLFRFASDVSIDPSVLKDVASHFDQARTLKGLPTRLGLSLHPKLMGLVVQKRSNWQIVKELNKILYRIDLESQFLDVSDALTKHTKETEKEKTQAKKLALEFEADQRPLERLLEPPPPATGSYENLRLEALQTHLLSIGHHHPNIFFRLQVPRSKLRSVLTDVSQTARLDSFECLADSILQTDVSAPGLESDEVCISETGTDESDLSIFFQAVHSNPSSRKVVSVSPAASSKLKNTDIAVHVFNTCKSSSDWMVCAPREGDQSALRLLRGLTKLYSYSELCGCLFMATVKADSMYFIDDDFFADPSKTLKASDLITKLLLSGAYQDLNRPEKFISFADLGIDIDMEGKSCLEQLLAGGLLETKCDSNDPNGQVPLWRITAGLLSQLRLCKPFMMSGPVAQSFDHIVMEPSIHELWCRLENAGFEWRALKQKEDLNYVVGGPKLWGTRGKQLHLENLQCLLQAEDLKDKFGITCIPSGQPKNVYVELLQGKEPEQPKPDHLEPTMILLDDIEMPKPSKPKHVVQSHRRHRRKLKLRSLEDGQSNSDGVAHDDEEEIDMNDDSLEQVERLVSLFESEPETVDLPSQNQHQASASSTLPPVDTSTRQNQSSSSKGDTSFPSTFEKGGKDSEDPMNVPGKSESIIKNPLHGISTANYTWGAFRFTFKRTGAQVLLQSTCPFHAKSSATGCKKSLNISPATEEKKKEVTRLLKFWSNSARQYTRQRLHMAMPLDISTCPEEAVLDSQVISASEKPDVVQTDAELDKAAKEKGETLDSGHPDNRKKVSSKPKAKPKAKKQSKGKGKAQPKKRIPSLSTDDSSSSSDSPGSSSSSSKTTSTSSSSGHPTE